MSDKKNNNKINEHGGAAGSSSGNGRRPQSDADAAGTIHQRPEHYLVAVRPPHLLPPGVQPAAADPDALFQWLSEQPDTRLLARLPRRQGSRTAIEPACPEIAVVEMPPERAASLRGSVQLLVEPDMPLSYGDPNPVVNPLALPDPDVIVGLREPTRVPVLVTDSKHVPLEGIDVILLGATWPARGRTGADGRVVLELPDDTLETVRELRVQSAQDHWSRRVERPALSADENVVVLKRMSETFEQFPQRQITGWGHEALGLDLVPPTHRADGVRIAILDSGVDVEHPDLAGRIVAGHDFTADDADTWTADEIGHGTACAGIITGTDDTTGISGIALDAEVHACKIFPNGRFSHLIKALDYCIDHEIDIAHLSLGSTHASELVALKVLDACNAGIACIAPAGNNGGMVTFPGTLPSVLTVAALGKVGEFPVDSQHRLQASGRRTSADGYFSPAFNCFGREVDVCAPGVAIPVAAPADGYTLRDGTAIAAAHITGLTALVLAHHDGFRDWFRVRNAARVGYLFHTICTSSRLVAPADPTRSGAGLPNAARALGLLLPEMATTPGSPTATEFNQQAAADRH
ncbi:S8 family serine peptidase [Saccharopolyspora sp. WRP15-2]|uniref:S8 family serine peptidase n=1 Tax=Saccharopolyspora oryzae TaxID=2997343 RepID=A0ABT4URY0_9PSEU|nr:S8 family serine peptidase [Saccharopolyspora oryzae]MDA3623859.1 S8 family serine peptidase [Saccharopolyspora oryzae]